MITNFYSKALKPAGGNMDRRDFIRIVTSVYTSNILLLTLTTSAQGRKLVMKGDEASIEEGEETGFGSGNGDSRTRKQWLYPITERPGAGYFRQAREMRRRFVQAAG